MPAGGDPLEIARGLASEPVLDLQPVTGGGNNRVFRVVTRRGDYALKVYAGGASERYEREFGGLRFLWDAGERRIPEPVALDPAAGAALYGWIEGTATGPSGDDDLTAMAGFARSLFEAARAPGAAALPAAREAVLSHPELQRQLAQRVARLRTAGAPELLPLLDDIEREAARRRPAADGDMLPRSGQTLSPSDFGLHNALRTPAGLRFIDFEYFGWDDPVKLVADVLWHPGMALGEDARQKFWAAGAEVYKVDSDFLSRFERDAPLYGLRWALIVLGEFLPEVWQRRVAAGIHQDAVATRAAQLAKADALTRRAVHGAVVA